MKSWYTVPPSVAAMVNSTVTTQLAQLVGSCKQGPGTLDLKKVAHGVSFCRCSSSGLGSYSILQLPRAMASCEATPTANDLMPRQGYRARFDTSLSPNRGGNKASQIRRRHLTL